MKLVIGSDHAGFALPVERKIGTGTAFELKEKCHDHYNDDSECPR
jgi:hypothetical protein